MSVLLLKMIIKDLAFSSEIFSESVYVNLPRQVVMVTKQGVIMQGKFG